jgi:hypothetical protein
MQVFIITSFAPLAMRSARTYREADHGPALRRIQIDPSLPATLEIERALGADFAKVRAVPANSLTTRNAPATRHDAAAIVAEAMRLAAEHDARQAAPADGDLCDEVMRLASVGGDDPLAAAVAAIAAPAPQAVEPTLAPPPAEEPSDIALAALEMGPGPGDIASAALALLPLVRAARIRALGRTGSNPRSDDCTS